MGAGLTLRMTLPRIPDVELVAVEGLTRLASHTGIPDEKVGEAKILVTEAIINALEHSGMSEPSVDVEFTLTKESLVIFVKDQGKGFEVGSVEEPDIATKLGSTHKRGWGLKLMKSMSDDFRIESGKDGTRITIVKKLS